MLKDVSSDTSTLLHGVVNDNGAIHETCSPKKPLFGHAFWDETLNKAFNVASEHKIQRFYQKEVSEKGVTTLTLCNCFRIRTIRNSANIITEVYHFGDRRWKRANKRDFEELGDIRLFPMKYASNPTSIVGSFLRFAAWQIWSQSAFDETTYQSLRTNNSQRIAYSMTVWVFFRDAQLRPIDSTHKRSLSLAAKAFIKNLWLILDRRFINPLIGLNGGNASLGRALKVARSANGFIKLHKEYSNLLPLTRIISPRFWGHDALMSKDSWLKKPGNKTSVLRPDFTIAGVKKIECLSGPRALKRLKTLPFSALQVIVDNSTSMAGCKFTELIDLLGALEFPKDSPKTLYWIVSSQALHLSEIKRSDYELFKRFLQTQLIYHYQRWKIGGHNLLMTDVFRAKNKLKHQPSRGVVDWLTASGFEKGFPQKNATFISLLARSNAWHREMAIAYRANYQAQVSKCKPVCEEWSVLLGSFELGQWSVHELGSVRALEMESLMMDHCVGWDSQEYARLCSEDLYRVFCAINLVTEERVTIGINFGNGFEDLDQVVGCSNNKASASARKLGVTLARMLSYSVQENA